VVGVGGWVGNLFPAAREMGSSLGKAHRDRGRMGNNAILPPIAHTLPDPALAQARELLYYYHLYNLLNFALAS